MTQHYLITEIHSDDVANGCCIHGPFGTRAQAEAYFGLLPAIEKLLDSDYSHDLVGYGEDIETDRSVHPYLPLLEDILGHRLSRIENGIKWIDAEHKAFHVKRYERKQSQAIWIACQLVGLGLEPPAEVAACLA